MRTRIGIDGASFARRAAAAGGILAASAAVALASAAPSGLLAPNDDCATAAPVFDGLNAGLSNVGSTTSGGVPAACVGINSDVWFSYTASCTGTAVFTTCPAGAGTLADTVVQVFDGTGGCGALVSVGCNDDSCGLRSSVSVPVTSGTLYYVRIGDFGATSPATGTFDLTITCCAGPAPNDECAGASPVVTGMNAGLSNFCSTTSLGVPAACAPISADVWYSYVATCTGPVTFTTCPDTAGSLGDTIIQVFDVTAGCGALVPVACNDDSCGLHSTVVATLVAGTTYAVRIGAYGAGGSQGTYDLLISNTGGAGSVAVNPTGCGILVLASTGSPTPGATVSFTLSGITGAGTFIWLGPSLGPGGIPLCLPAPCALGAMLSFLFPGPALAVPVPCDPGLVGGAISAQGGDILGVGGCGVLPFGFPFSVSSTLDIVIG